MSSFPLLDSLTVIYLPTGERCLSRAALSFIRRRKWLLLPVTTAHGPRHTTRSSTTKRRSTRSSVSLHSISRPVSILPARERQWGGRGDS